MKIKLVFKRKKKWNPDEVVDKEYNRLPQLNKHYKQRTLHGFGGR